MSKSFLNSNVTNQTSTKDNIHSHFNQHVRFWHKILLGATGVIMIGVSYHWKKIFDYDPIYTTNV